MCPTGRTRLARELQTCRKIKLMIQILHADTVHSIERWEGHPCITHRVFGPPEYLINPPRQPTKPRPTARLHTTSGRSRITSQQPPTQLGSFQATRAQHGGHNSKPKEQGASASAKFAAWFNTTFAISDPQLRRKAILASWEATSAILMEACQSQEGSTEASSLCRPKATHGCPDTQLEY